MRGRLERRKPRGRILLGPGAPSQASEGSHSWGCRVGETTSAELKGCSPGRGGAEPGHLVRSPDGRRGGWVKAGAGILGAGAGHGRDPVWIPAKMRRGRGDGGGGGCCVPN